MSSIIEGINPTTTPIENLYNYLEFFNKNNNINLQIDTIRIEFKKQYKIEKLKEFGVWEKIKKNTYIMQKLKKRLQDDEVTSTYKLKDKNIYYYNSNKDKPKYRNAILVIFGISQYNKEPIPLNLIKSIFNMLTYGKSKVNVNIDLCHDMKQQPNIRALQNQFQVQQQHTKGIFGSTYYIHNTYNEMINKITIYDKAYKNGLEGILWRIEATITIPNIRALAVPLHEFKEIIEITKGIR
jgi:hypothetical protein